MHKILHILIFLLVFNIYYINLAFSSSYVSANDFGDLPTVVVKAKPDHVSSVSSYSPDIASESITWVDSGLYTDGDPTGFYFEISGGWNPWTNSLTDYNNLCFLETKETIYPNSTGNNTFDIAVETGVNSEFDYITSSYKVTRNHDTYVKEEQSTEVKRSCWLTGGMGLYIAFFGTSGLEEPDIATHMKVADIACDYPYNTDKNGDGVLTVDECYLPGDNSRNNQAYYRPYVSDQVVGGVRCEAVSFLEDPTSRSGKVKVADCFDMINGEKIYKVKFTFQAKNLYKNKSGALVGANEKIKFGIYDRYYSDNHGEYKITLERGVSKDKTSGFLFEKIMKTIEEMFSISSLEKNYIKDFKTNISNILENNTNILLSSLKISNFSLINNVYANAQNNTTLTNEEELYQKKVSLIKQFYKNIVYDGIFLQTIRTFIMLYICFLGLNLAMGGFQYSVKEFMNIVLKLSFILAFLSESGWDLYNEYIVTFFLKGLMSATTNIINIANKTYSPNAYIYIPEGTSLSSLFINIDSSLAFYFNRVITNKIWSLVFGVWCGIFLVIAIYLSIIFFFIKFVSSTFPIMIAYIELVLGLIIGPVFISFYLFKETQSIFMNWLAFLGARAANIFFTVFILSIFAETIKAQFVELLSFPIYYIEILPSWLKTFFKVVFHKDISWVVAVADFSVAQKPGFGDMGILIGKVFALVQLFSLILNALPGIIDSIVDIKGGITFYNSSFRNNYVKSENGEAKGGAIYGSGVTITADNYTSIIDGNKANDESNAFYVLNKTGGNLQDMFPGGNLSLDAEINMPVVGDLTLNTLNNGVILLNDGIDGESGYSVAMTGDKGVDTAGSTGGLSLFNNDGDGRTSQYIKLNNSIANAGNIDIVNTTLSFGEGPYGRGEITADGDPITKISLQNAAFDLYNGYTETVNLKGWSASNSYLHVDVNIATGTADVLNIAGDVVGQTKVIVYADSEEVTDKSILFATATGNGAEESFTVYRVYNSPYMFDVAYNPDGENGKEWSLTMTDEENDYAGVEPGEQPDPEVPDIDIPDIDIGADPQYGRQRRRTGGRYPYAGRRGQLQSLGQPDLLHLEHRLAFCD